MISDCEGFTRWSNFSDLLLYVSGVIFWRCTHCWSCTSCPPFLSRLVLTAVLSTPRDDHPDATYSSEFRTRPGFVATIRDYRLRTSCYLQCDTEKNAVNRHRFFRCVRNDDLAWRGGEDCRLGSRHWHPTLIDISSIADEVHFQPSRCSHRYCLWSTTSCTMQSAARPRISKVLEVSESGGIELT